MHARDKRHKYSIMYKQNEKIYIHFNKISNLLFYKQTSRTGIHYYQITYLKNTNPILNLVVIFKKKLWHLQLK